MIQLEMNEWEKLLKNLNMHFGLLFSKPMFPLVCQKERSIIYKNEPDKNKKYIYLSTAYTLDYVEASNIC